MNSKNISTPKEVYVAIREYASLRLTMALKDGNFKLAETIHDDLEYIEKELFKFGRVVGVEGYKQSGIAWRQCMDCRKIECITENPYTKEGWHDMKDFGFHDERHIGDISHSICPDCTEKRR